MAVAAAPVWAQDAAAPVVPDVPDMMIGNLDSKVVLTEYASYTCPHCANFHTEVFKDLKRDYIDTGKIKFVYREVFFDRYGLWAAMIARCGGDLRYFGIQDLIYSTQKEWASSQDPAVIIENLRRLGRTAGLDDAAMDVCLNDAAMAQAMVAKFQKDSEADDINSTPSFVLNGVKHSNMNYADLKALLDAELAK
ncbi:DsbA family protein [Pseudorhodobacter sp. W20_MBD10_FR17]|uniref:DsbA family protein n=1 Tax=Pseudorhodobacter sp. W20_MBD10_FR17 TaxID=3240266 RepID=UPI003F95FC16